MSRLIIAGCFFLVVGCGGASSTSVKGTVKYDGNPVSTGSITFRPPNAGPAVPGFGAPIKDGQYELSVPPDNYRVEISASRPGTQKDSMGRVIDESYIPKQYNSESQLTAKVAGGAANVFDFDLKGKK